MLLLVGDNGKVEGAVVFPRDPQSRSRIGGYFTTTNDSVSIPAEKLPEFLKEREAHLVAF